MDTDSNEENTDEDDNDAPTSRKRVSDDYSHQSI